MLLKQLFKPFHARNFDFKSCICFINGIFGLSKFYCFVAYKWVHNVCYNIIVDRRWYQPQLLHANVTIPVFSLRIHKKQSLPIDITISFVFQIQQNSDVGQNIPGTDLWHYLRYKIRLYQVKCIIILIHHGLKAESICRQQKAHNMTQLHLKINRNGSN